MEGGLVWLGVHAHLPPGCRCSLPGRRLYLPASSISKTLSLLGLIGSIVLFGEVSALPRQLGLDQLIHRHVHENHRSVFLLLPLTLFWVFGPIFVAAWFFRLCHRLAYPSPTWVRRPKTRATRWLVWLGIFCMVVPPMIAMLTTFNHLTESPNAPIPAQSISDSLWWLGGPPLIGSLLMFFGLVRRQTIAEPGETISLPETK